MRVVIATDTLAPELTAFDTARALAAGWRAGAPDVDVRVAPLAAGGPGTLDLLAAGTVSGAEVVTVPGADGAPRPTRTCVLATPRGPQVWVDPAEAVGTLAEHGARAVVDAPPSASRPATVFDPVTGTDTAGEDRYSPGARLTRVATTGSSRGVADLLTATTGSREIVVTAGDLAAHDGGLGMLARLGQAPPALARTLDAGGLAAGALGPEADEDLTATVARALRALDGATLRVAAATDEPLFGLHGAQANLARATGVDAQAAQDLERSLGAAFARLDRVRAAAFTRAGRVGQGAPLALAGTAARRSGTSAGSGGGGGLAAMLEYLGAVVAPAAEVVAGAVGLDDAMEGADLVVTAVPVLDGAMLSHSVPATVGRRALERAVPVVAIARDVRTSARELAPIGVVATYAVTTPRRGHLPPPRTPEELLRDAEDRASRLAATWRL